jgi:hypothetical protein
LVACGHWRGKGREIMPLDDSAEPTVRPTVVNNVVNGASPPDFGLALDAALAPLDRMMGSRWPAEALARARVAIMAAFADATKAEKRRIVAALSPAELRKEVQQLLDSHEALLDYLDDLERQPVIAAEVKKLRARGEIPWPL